MIFAGFLSTFTSIDFLHFHGFLTGLMKFFEEFAKRYNREPWTISLLTDFV